MTKLNPSVQTCNVDCYLGQFGHEKKITNVYIIYAVFWKSYFFFHVVFMGLNCFLPLMILNQAWKWTIQIISDSNVTKTYSGRTCNYSKILELLNISFKITIWMNCAKPSMLISSHLKCTFSCQSSLPQWLLNRFSWICCIVVSWISLCAGRKNVAFCVHSRFEWVLVHIGTEQLLKHLANKIETGRFHELSQLALYQNASLLFFSIISIT